MSKMNELVISARSCTICKPFLADGVNPVFVVHPKAKVLVIGQAPGRKVHLSGKAWADASGNRLRDWLNVTEDEFYDPEIFSILPMGFCFPGSKKGGDLPPRPECAPLWHETFIRMMPEVELVLLIGNYAQKYYLKKKCKNNLTETVRNWESYGSQYIPLPHPSPRNNIWLRKNEWFEAEVLPNLKNRMRGLLAK